MPAPLITAGDVLEGTDAVYVARVVGPELGVLVSGDFSTYDLRVFDQQGETPVTAVYSDLAVAVSAGSPIFDILQLDGYWDNEDDSGYNLRRVVTDTQLHMEGGHSYRVEFLFTSTSFGVIPVLFYPRVVALQSV